MSRLQFISVACVIAYFSGALSQQASTWKGIVTYANENGIPAISEELITYINSLGASWKAEVNKKFATATLTDVRKLLGTVRSNDPGYVGPPFMKTEYAFGNQSIPESFDSREAWPQCAHIIGHVRDQSVCGSCWAFGSTEAFNDRYCIATGDYKTLFSPEDTVSCCSGLHCGFSMGCNGGQPAGAWHWFTKDGVSSGGDFPDKDTGATCKPYSMMSCAHHVSPPPGSESCDKLPDYETPKCVKQCTDKKYLVEYPSDKKRAASVYGVVGEKNMQLEIMQNGPISVALTVFQDFEAYSSGVYSHVTGMPLGGHAVKMIGWGVDHGVPYWICVNSWNDAWGEKGTFRILRGKNECGIEMEGVAGEVHGKKPPQPQLRRR